jgi:DNA-binding CsgD family transcriptional regulator
VDTLVEQTDYGYRVVMGRYMLPHETQHGVDLLRRQIQADPPRSFSVAIDIRGASGCPGWTVTILTDLFIWLGAHGLRRSAVIFDHAVAFMHLRSAAQAAFVYDTQRYFDARHTATADEELARWLRGAGSVGTALRRVEHLAELAVMLDGLSEGVMLCEQGGAVLVENSALRHLLSSDVEASRVRQAMLAFAAERIQARATAGALATVVDHASTVVHTVLRAYNIRCTLSSGGWFGAPQGVLIALEPIVNTPLDDSEVQSRFGLTGRELAVARHVAVGKTNVEIADLLQISAHTVRNHVERILAKLHVRNRTGVSALLLATKASAGLPRRVSGVVATSAMAPAAPRAFPLPARSDVPVAEPTPLPLRIASR